jgi:hypothetical protein
LLGEKAPLLIKFKDIDFTLVHHLIATKHFIGHANSGPMHVKNFGSIDRLEEGENVSKRRER